MVKTQVTVNRDDKIVKLDLRLSEIRELYKMIIYNCLLS